MTGQAMDGPPLAPGTMVGVYRIEALIGGGGQARVYRARDTQIGRSVAIKILPAHWLDDAGRRERFDREARVLGALNHPHVATIYGLAEGEGHRGLVLELVDGPTLANLVARGPLPVAQSLAYARQIALALEAAHDKGIVHRDLKPANVKVTPGGVVKVLDFGLAKLSVEDESRPGDAPTLTLNGTRDGLVIGTVAYMSPEQARGKPVDKRTDVWAFGCVLYEMLTGHQAFAGETATDTLAAVIERPPDWTVLPADMPEPMRKLLARCLEKDPARRLRDIADARLELDDALSSERPSAAAVPTRSRRVSIGLAVAIAAVLIAVGVFAMRSHYLSTPPEAAQTPSSRSALQLTRLTFDPGLQTDPSLSRDGRFVAYSANKTENFDIYTQPVAGGNAVRVTDHPAHDWQPDWSVKDEIVFRSERDGGGLYVVPPTGGNERRVATFGHQPRWSPDGTRVLFTRSTTNTFHVVSLDGSEPIECRPCATLGTAYGWFRDSTHVSLLQAEPAPQFTPHLVTVDLETGRSQEWNAAPGVQAGFRELGVLVPREPLAWSADARALYFVGASQNVSAIWRLDVDPGSQSLIGGPDRLAAMAEDSAGISAAATGALAFAAAERIPRIWWYPFDPSGRRLAGPPEALTSPQTRSSDPSITADGRLLVFSVTQPGGRAGAELRIRTRLSGTERTVAVSDGAHGEQRNIPHISADGQRIVFRYVAPESEGRGRGGGFVGTQSLRMIDLTSNKETALTSTAPGLILPSGWSRDGRFVVVTYRQNRLRAGAEGMAIGLLPIDGAPDAERQLRILTTNDRTLWQPALSSNGRWMAFVVGPIFQIAVIGSKDGSWTKPQDKQAWRFIADDGWTKDKPRWSPDGRLLYFTSARGGLLNVWAVPFDPVSGSNGPPFQLTGFNGPGEQIPAQITSFEIGVARTGLAIPTVRPTGAILLLHPPR